MLILIMIIGLQVPVFSIYICQLDSRAYLEECLHSFLPEELRDGAPTGFAMTGHIGLFH